MSKISRWLSATQAVSSFPSLLFLFPRTRVRPTKTYSSSSSRREIARDLATRFQPLLSSQWIKGGIDPESRERIRTYGG